MAAKKKESELGKGTILTDSGLTLQDLEKELELGVMPDSFNYKKLFALFFAGILLVLVLILFSAELYRYFDFKQSFEAAVRAEYPELTSLQAEHKRLLTTFEVLDDEKGIFRIPVDSAFTLILNETR